MKISIITAVAIFSIFLASCAPDPTPKPNSPGGNQENQGANIQIVTSDATTTYEGKQWPDGTLFMTARLHGFDQCPDSPVFFAEILQNPKYTGYLNGLYNNDLIRNGDDVNAPKTPLIMTENPEECYYEQVIQEAFSKSIFSLPENGVCGIDKLEITFDAQDGESNHIWKKDISCKELSLVLSFKSISNTTPTVVSTIENTSTPTVVPTATAIPGYVRFQGVYSGRIVKSETQGFCITIDNIIDLGDDLKIGDQVCIWDSWDLGFGCYNTSRYDLNKPRLEFYGARTSPNTAGKEYDYDLCLNENSYLKGIDE